MSENFKHTSGPTAQNPQDVPAQLQKIQQHLIFLEKKIDTLIAGQAQGQSQGQRGSFPRKDFSRPRRTFGQTSDAPRYDRKPEGRRDFQDRGRSERGAGPRRFGQDRERPERPEKRKFFGGGKRRFPGHDKG